jgi:hypothetical protein
MSRTKKVPFADSLDIWLETASEIEIRDAAGAMAVWARVRRFPWRLKIEAAPVEKPLPLLDGGKK